MTDRDHKTHQYFTAKRRLRAAFPVLFVSPRHPWKIGIWKDMAAARPDIMYDKHVSHYIGDFTKGKKYLKSVIDGMPRIDINGVCVSDVTEREKEWSRKMMEKKNG